MIFQQIQETDDRQGLAEIRLEGYQWAELNVREEYRDAFTGFGEDEVVALTARYTIVSKAPRPLDLSTLTAKIRVSNGEVKETTDLSPAAAGILKPRSAEERLAVFLFPRELVQGEDDFTLVFDELRTADGADAFDGGSPAFELRDPY
ncbi:hypothetical protein QWJ34_11715 [Saccharibacillus sp. CPCC 101409]|uniref:hypothetical protein n=1 Tax=Saccharibacillus sp. CPCC 101409 TaxID=3058041 RepID=UPI002672488E|nr:hypothetical protein [Saccharibacillus sp. CPCC 101409]MDO3410430.1 hypothetical protein [Saccharibacillus sp. CPCC 101409]